MSEIRFWRAVFSLLALAVVVLFFLGAWNVIVPFLMGGVIAYLVYPLVDRLVAMGYRQDRVVLILYISLLLIAGLLGSWLLPALVREANLALTQLPTYAEKLNGVVLDLNYEIQTFLRRFLGDRAEGISIPFDASKFIEQLFYKLPANILNVAHFGLWILIIPFVGFFVLTQGQKWIDMLFQWTPSEYVESLLGLLAEINASLGGYIRGTLLDAMCVGFMTMFGLLIIGLDGAVLLGFITGLLNIIPFMAPLVGGSLALLAGYFQGFSMGSLLAILVLYLSVRLFDDFLFIPFVVGQSVALHPVIILLAVLSGIELGGFLGLVFAIPVAAVVKVIVTILLRSRRESFYTHQQHV